MTDQAATAAQHTAGPWRFRAPPTADKGNPWVVLDRDSHVVAIVPRSPRETNARLIAAAPDLLAALKDAYAVLLHVGGASAGILTEQYRAAIARAEGR